MNVETVSESKFDSVTIQVPSPDGTMFVTISEDTTGKPIAVFIHIGKAGAPIAAWSNALARMISVSLDHGAKLDDIMTELSGQTSDRLRITSQGESVRSGVEAVWVALMKYKRDKFEKVRATLGDLEEHRGPRLGR